MIAVAAYERRERLRYEMIAWHAEIVVSPWCKKGKRPKIIESLPWRRKRVEASSAEEFVAKMEARRREAEEREL